MYKLLIILFLLTKVGYSQSAYQGKFNFYAGAGLAYYKVFSSYEVQDNARALPLQYRVAFDYNTHKEVSLGLEYWHQKFLTDRNELVRVAKSDMLGLSLKFNFLDHEKSNAYVAISVGGFNFNYAVSDSLGRVGAIRAEGVFNSVSLGYTKYFGHKFGLFVKAGILNMPMMAKEFVFDGVNYDHFANASIDNWKLLARGGFVNLGLAILIGKS